MKRHPAILITLVVAAVWLSGCSASPVAAPSLYEPAPTGSLSEPDRDTGTATPSFSPGGERSAAIPTCTPLDEEEAMTTQPGGATPEASSANEAQCVVQLAKEDLSRRLDLPPEEILAISVEAVDWPDTSLGCPQPRTAYAQVITPGYLIVLGAEGQTYEYHTDQHRAVVWCGSDGDLSPKGTDRTVDDGWPSQPRDEGEVDSSRITPIVPPQ